MKKLVALAMTMTMMLSMFGCGTTSESVVESTEVLETVVADEDTEEVFDASEYKIALVTDTLGTEKFLLQAYDEFILMSEELGFTATSLECSDTNAWSEMPRTAAVNGYDLVIGLGWQAAEVFSTLADEFPDTKFAVIDTTASNDAVSSISYNTADGAYVLGALVANAFPEDTVFGYIGNFQGQSNYEYRYGFLEGLKSVTPDAELIVNFANTYSDTSAVYDLAKQQAATGVSFIMGSVSSSANEGIYQAVLDLEEEGKMVYTSGLSEDQTREENAHIIGGLTKDTALTTRMLIEEFLSDTLEDGARVVGFAEGAFGVVHVNTGDVNYVNEEIITTEVLEATMKAADDIISGAVVIEVPMEEQ